MAKKSLPPGFRFHPTDVELIMYYLKRKLKGKKIHAEPITEVNIYKFSPWDLPDKSCLRSNDLEWFFFCPRERKYASGARVKRATENGYWKITGKERSINYNDKSVGTVKTLIFHLGHSPHGERTNWVIHEYKILDDQLAVAGVQDTYVLCKVFKKNGLGPKNGAQYGAPFKEKDWSDDETDIAQDSATPFLTPGGPSSPRLLSKKQNFVQTSLFGLGSTSGLSTIEEGPSPSAGPVTGDVGLDDDEIDRLLAMFRDDVMLPHNENGNHKNDQREIAVVPFLDGNDIYNDLQDLDNGAPMNEAGFDFSGTLLQDDLFNSLNNNNILLQEDNNPGGGYIELNDLLLPLDYHQPPQFVANNQLYNMFGSYSYENVPHGFASSESQLPVQANGPNDLLQMVNNNQSHYNYYQNAAAFDLDFSNTAGNNTDHLFNQENDTGRFDDVT